MSRNFYILMCLINVLISALFIAFLPTPISGIPNAIISLAYLPKYHDYVKMKQGKIIIEEL